MVPQTAVPRTAREKGVLMRRISVWALAFILVGAVAASAAPPGPQTEEQKTLYALGLAMSQSVSVFSLSEAELEMVQAGFADGVLHRAPKVEVQAYAPKIQEIHTARAATLAAAEKKSGQSAVDKAASE